MKARFVGLVFSILIIAAACISLYFVSKIVEIGGVGYAWEFGPPLLFLLLGVFLLCFWVYRDFQTRRKT